MLTYWIYVGSYLTIGFFTHGIRSLPHELYTPYIIGDLFFWPIIGIVGLGRFTRKLFLGRDK